MVLQRRQQTVRPQKAAPSGTDLSEFSQSGGFWVGRISACVGPPVFQASASPASAGDNDQTHREAGQTEGSRFRDSPEQVVTRSRLETGIDMCPGNLKCHPVVTRLAETEVEVLMATCRKLELIGQSVER